MEPVVTAVIGAAGGVISGVLGALATLRAKGVDRWIEDRKLWVSAYDTKLLEQRLVEYKKLWKLTQPTSRRHVAELDRAGARRLAGALTSWYYADGGMVMSEVTRDAFFAARESLDVLERDPDSEGLRQQVVERFSMLRTALCEDMNSRRGPTLRVSESKDMAQAAREEELAPAPPA